MITEFKLDPDDGCYEHVIEGGKLIMIGDYCVGYEITREAAIEYAKHFKLTSEELTHETQTS